MRERQAKLAEITKQKLAEQNSTSLLKLKDIILPDHTQESMIHPQENFFSKREMEVDLISDETGESNNNENEMKAEKFIQNCNCNRKFSDITGLYYRFILHNHIT